MIKAVFFDFDGVLTTDEYGWLTISNNYHAKTGISIEKLNSCFKPFIKPLKNGEVNHVDIWDKFCACLGEDLDIKILDYVFRTIPKNEKMFEIVGVLKKNGYKTGIISANFIERFESLKDEFSLENIFDVFAISANVQAFKDDRKLFEYILNETGLNPEECIFVDNTQKHLEVPVEMGFTTYFHDCQKNDAQAFVKFLKDNGISL